MSNREFTATRTMLANAMAIAGAELLEYMGTAGALAAIPNTDKYVAAGTLQGILSMAGKVMGESAPAAQSELSLRAAIERALKGTLIEDGTIAAFNSVVDDIEREVLAIAPAVPAPSQVPAKPQVGCEWDDGLLRVHGESTTCEVCAPARLSGEQIKVALEKAGVPFDAPYVYAAVRTIERELRAGSRCAQPELDQLHNAIMNLPCRRTMSHFASKDEMLAYKVGHRDARHAAAELVNGVELRAGSSDVRDQAHWRPIQSVPTDGSEVLLYLPAPYNRVVKARWFDVWENWIEGEFPDPHDEYCGIGSRLPTHWMPLPTLPAAAPAASKEGDAE